MRQVISEYKNHKDVTILKKKPMILHSPKFSNIFLWLSILVIIFLGSCSIIPGWITPYTPTTMQADQILQAPSFKHLFGTDYFGRDVFSLVVYGSRASLLVGICAVLVSSLVGSALGMIVGYIGGFMDVIFMRIHIFIDPESSALTSGMFF